MWIILPSGEMKNLDTICAFVPSADAVMMEHELPGDGGVRLTKIASTHSLAVARDLIEDIAAQIDDDFAVIRVPSPAPRHDDTELEPFQDLRRAAD